MLVYVVVSMYDELPDVISVHSKERDARKAAKELDDDDSVDIYECEVDGPTLHLEIE